MENLTLVMGPKNYSSWSMRPWLALKHAGLPFEVVSIRFDRPDAVERIRRYSSTGKVPILIHGELTVAVSLAICEYVAELAPEARLWPEERAVRAHARSVSAEMVGGFAALRTHMPMNVRARKPGKGRGPGVEEDIERIKGIWGECRERYGERGEFLFGDFSIADAMYAPVVTRFLTYDVQVGPFERDYMDAICALPIVREWFDLAHCETERIEDYDL